MSSLKRIIFHVVLVLAALCLLRAEAYLAVNFPSPEQTAPADFPADAHPLRIKFPMPCSGAFSLSGHILINEYVDKGPAGFSDQSPATIAVVLDESGEPLHILSVHQKKLRLACRIDGGGWTTLLSEREIPLNQWTLIKAQVDVQKILRVSVEGKETSAEPRKVDMGTNMASLGLGAWGKRSLHGQIRQFSFCALPPVGAALPQPDYSARRLQVQPDAILPIAGGLCARATVWPDAEGTPGLITQSVGFGDTRVVFKGTPLPERLGRANGENIIQFGSGRYLPRVKAAEALSMPLFRLQLPGGVHELASTAKDPCNGALSLLRFRPEDPDGVDFKLVGGIPCGEKKSPFGKAYPGARLLWLGDMDGDSIPDLLLSTQRAQGSYYPDAPKNFWTFEDLPNSGRARGYTLNGKWLGGEDIFTLHWAKGRFDAANGISFGERLPIYAGEDHPFPAQWKGLGGMQAAVLKIGGIPHLAVSGDLDRIMAMPIRFGENEARVGVPKDLLRGGERLLQVYIPFGMDVFDLTGDGKEDLIISGNPGSVCVLSGDCAGNFTQAQAYTKGGPVAAQTLIVPARGDWTGDGIPDLVTGDASGWFMLWPGTADPKTYGQPRYFTQDGRPVHIQAGYYGSLQGPGEARWGYLNPTLCDWDGDGQLDIITSDINADLLLWKGRKGSLELARPIAFVHADGTTFKPAWRQRVAFMPAETGSGQPPRLMIMDEDGDTAILTPQSVGSTRISRIDKVRYQDGTPVVTSGPNGAFGRTKFVWTDWDGDGLNDLILSVNRINNRLFGEIYRKSDSMPFLLKNFGTQQNPVFARPVPLLLNAKPLGFGTHISAAWPVDWKGNGQYGLMIGAEDGRIYAFERDELTP